MKNQQPPEPFRTMPKTGAEAARLPVFITLVMLSDLDAALHGHGGPDEAPDAAAAIDAAAHMLRHYYPHWPWWSE